MSKPTNTPALASDVRAAYFGANGGQPDNPDFVRGVAAKNAQRWRVLAAMVRETAEINGQDLKASDQRTIDEMEGKAKDLEALAGELAKMPTLHDNVDVDDFHNTVIASYRHADNSEAFRGEGFKNPYVRAATRQMSDEEVFWRDWIAGREPQNHIDVSFAGQSHSRDLETGKFRPRADLTTSSATIATDVVPSLYRHIVESNVVMSVANVDNYDHGRSVVYPKSTVRGTAAITGEGTAISEGDGAFGSLTLGSWKYAQLLQVTNELLDDVEFDLLDYIAFDAGRAIGKASGAHFATGDGTNKPFGIIPAIADALGTAQQIGSATVEGDNLIDLFYDVSPQYRENAVWLMNDSTAKAVRKLKNANDEYLWTDGLNGAPATILGRPVLTDPAVSAIGSANLSVAFFNPNAYKIRTAPLRFERSDGFAFDKDMVTFRAVARMDGDLLDATDSTGAVADTD